MMWSARSSTDWGMVRPRGNALLGGSVLLNYPIRALQKGRGDGHPERFRGLEVDHKRV